MEPSKSYEANKNNAEASQAEFNALVLRHKTMLWHICSDYSLGRAWNIEDCMQEVLISLWRSFGAFEGRSSEKTWVWRVATNTMLMLRRKDVRSPQTESIETASVGEKGDEPSDESYQQLQQLIDTLPEESGTTECGDFNLDFNDDFFVCDNPTETCGSFSSAFSSSFDNCTGQGEHNGSFSEAYSYSYDR